MWALVAVASAACFAAVSVIDKRILDHHLPSISAFYLWITLTMIVYIAIVLGVTGIPWDAPGDRLLVTFISGLCLGAGLAFMFVGLKLEEASRAIAIAHVYPVYVALLAVTFLDETLSPVQWAAIVLVVLGTMQVSLHGVQGRSLLRPGRGAPFLLIAGVGQGIGYFAAKYALEELSIWTVFSFQQLGLLLVFGLFARPEAWRELISALRDRNTLVLMLAGETALPVVAILLSLLAASLGPISLVAAFLATRPLFVFIATTILSSTRWRFLEESLTPGSLALKFTAIVMIVAGVGVLGVL